MRLFRLCAVLCSLLLLAAACGDSDDSSEEVAGSTVRLITHDSFALSEETVTAFEEATGATLEIQQAGDAVEVVNRAILTAGDPEADVLFGVDNNTLQRALDAELFEEYSAAGLDGVRDGLDLDGAATPITLGDVCINFAVDGLTERGLDPPTSLADLTDPAYADLLVVQNPATSTPGLAFLLATIDEFGEDGWLDFWQQLRDNGVEVTNGWSDAYYGVFSGPSSEGDRPLVVSYASSPPVEVAFAEEEPEIAPTGVMLESCYRQIEFAGVLSGAENPAGAQALIDFMLTETYQSDLPLQQFVFPAVADTPLPEVFERFAEVADDPAQLSPADVEANREAWVDAWTDVMLR
ncbi:MAG: thiamine ABC transporter substrate-binding protein [Actinomycetota bacterium]